MSHALPNSTGATQGRLGILKPVNVHKVHQKSDSDNDRSSDVDSESLDVGNVLIYRGKRATHRNAQAKMKRYAEGLLESSDVSDFDYDEDEEEELDADHDLEFAPYETQMEAEAGHSFTQQELDIPDCEDIGPLPENYAAYRTELETCVEQIEQDGLDPTIKMAMEVEAASESKLGKEYAARPPLWKEMSYLTLCTLPPGVLQELTFGNLVQAVESNRELAETLEKIQDPRSTSSHNLHAGLRRHLQTTAEDHSDDRVKVIFTFCEQLEQRCRDMEDENAVLKPPLQYTGYAGRADVRQRQHEACGSSSNWLASVVQAICNLLWGRGFYLMRFFVVCPLSEEAQGPVAEMLLTRVPGSYYNAGGGFCIDVAGKSMESIHFNKLTRGKREERWNDLADWVESETSIISNWELHSAERLRVRQTIEDRELGQTWKDDENWQNDEARAGIEMAERLYEEACKEYPKFSGV
ncbi:hypothetical protein CC80DRAFT_535543 [Byssothecium circinans]|uniref:Uncharacterized protein n=1 Tax=Byssothecium circinans TaxID=147558 RepID=A0A6A5TVX0_9PLEO|nr:hypothetical protein CC80DRAFT_535543 [Byssothecium circinans]